MSKPATAGDMYREAALAAEAERPEVWLARRLAAGKPAESWVPVPGWYYEQVGLPVPVVPHQVSDQGRIRNAAGHVLSLRPNGRPKELPAEQQYRRTNLCTGGKKAPALVHHVVLAGLCPEDRAGRETRHLGQGDENRAWNWYPEGITWGDARENAFDKAPEARVAAAVKARAAQTAAGMVSPRPTFRCLTWARCGGMVQNDGSRCAACVVQVGKAAAVLLGLGMPSQAAGEFFGYTSGDWVIKLAIEHGGFPADRKAQARMQRPSLWQRVLLVQVKRRIKRGMR
jgi:hypothetical protein